MHLRPPTIVPSPSTRLRAKGMNSGGSTTLLRSASPRMAIGIRDIAERVGVSYQTAADILGDSDVRRQRYSKQTRERIALVAAEMGYRPNAAAKAVTTGRFNNIALLLSTERNRSYLPASLLDGILRELTPRQMHLALARLDDRGLTDPVFMPRILREWSADGLLLDYTHAVPERMTQLIETNELPAVWINIRREFDAVYPDDKGAGELITRHLLELGHRRIAYLCLIHGRDIFASLHYSVHDRVEGYEQAMRDAHLQPWTIIPEAGIGGVELVKWLRQFLQQPQRPTALIFESGRDLSAAAVAAASCGLSVPEDLSIVGFTDGDEQVGGLALTASRIDRSLLGADAVKMLLQTLDHRQRHPAQMIPFTLSPGQTARQPR
jgi:LacI family transcriptional regulator